MTSHGYSVSFRRQTHLVNHSIPGKPGIVHNNMNLATAKLGRPLHERLDVLPIQNISDHSQRAARLNGVDSVSNGVRLI